MRKLFVQIVLITGIFLVNSAKAAETLVVAATKVPQTDILKQVKPILAKQGIDLQIKVINDYLTPNLLLVNKQVDANYFQNKDYLEEQNKVHGTNLVALKPIEVEVMGLYAISNNNTKKFIETKNIQDIAKGTIIGIPDDRENKARALFFLQSKGFIKLKPGVKLPERDDIIDNPLDISFYALNPNKLATLLMSKEISMAVINGNFALQASFNPNRDAVFVESPKDIADYSNIVVVRNNEVNDPKIKKLDQALHSKMVKNFISEKYKGAVIPSF